MAIRVIIRLEHTLLNSPLGISSETGLPCFYHYAQACLWFQGYDLRQKPICLQC
jgi:hypothetical protein